MTRTKIKAGDLVICMDDGGCMNPRYKPTVGQVYTVRRVSSRVGNVPVLVYFDDSGQGTYEHRWKLVKDLPTIKDDEYNSLYE